MPLGSHGLIGSLFRGGGGPGETVLIGVAAFVYLVYRQVTPRALSTRSLVLVPLILLYFLWRSLPSFSPTPTILVETSVDAVVTLVLGLLAVRQLQVYSNPTTGRAMVGGSLRYFLWWLAAFVAKAGLAIAFGVTAANVTGLEILLPVFLLVASRNAYLYWRAVSIGLPLH